jgi:FkbM family methyltransferase
MGLVLKHLPRGRYPLMNWLGRFAPRHPFPARFEVEGRQIAFWCDLRNSLAREVYFLGTYEPQETLLLGSLLHPGVSFVDVGAHWGYFSLLAAVRVGPEGRVLAIEADPRVFDTLRRTLDLNAGSSVEAVHIAVGDRGGTLVLHGFDEQADNWGVSSIANGQGGTSFSVPSQPLDALLESHQVSEVQLLKMDIEGAEILALRGAERLLKEKRIHRMLLEVHPQQLERLGSSASELLQLLRGHGYQLWAVDHSLRTSRAVAYGHLRDAAKLLTPLDSDVLGVWPHILVSRDERPFA